MPELSSIAVGDKVIILHLDGKRKIATVERVTATQFVANGYRFTMYGRRVGESRNAWRNTYARAATPELIESINRQNDCDEAYDNCRRQSCMLDTQLRKISRTHGNYVAKAAAMTTALAYIQAACAELQGLLPNDDAGAHPSSLS